MTHTYVHMLQCTGPVAGGPSQDRPSSGGLIARVRKPGPLG